MCRHVYNAGRRVENLSVSSSSRKQRSIYHVMIIWGLGFRFGSSFLWLFRWGISRTPINLTLKAVTESEPNADGPWAFLDTALHRDSRAPSMFVVNLVKLTSYVAIYVDTSAISEYSTKYEPSSPAGPQAPMMTPFMGQQAVPGQFGYNQGCLWGGQHQDPVPGIESMQCPPQLPPQQTMPLSTFSPTGQQPHAAPPHFHPQVCPQQ